MNTSIRNENIKKPKLKVSNVEDNNTTNNDSCGIYSFTTVFTMKNILEAARLCKINVFWKASVQNFMRAVHYNCALLFYKLHTNKFTFQSTNEFDIRERGKLRHIKSIKIRDRVVQKVLCHFCLMPLFQPSFIYDNCASIKGKGISFAFSRLTAMLQKYYREHGNQGYVLRFDFKNYFGSIDHELVMQMISKKLHDKKLLDLIEAAMDIYSNDDNRIGVGLGSELSQFVALLFASPIDHHIKDRRRFKYYIRYMDDGIIIHHDKQELKELLKEIKEICDELHLELNMKKTLIEPISHEIRFLKKNIILTDTGKIIMKVSRDTITRMRRKLKSLLHKVDEGILTVKNVEDSYVSWRGFVRQFDAYDTINQMDSIFKELFGYIPESKKDRKIRSQKAVETKINAICNMAESFFVDRDPYMTLREEYYNDIDYEIDEIEEADDEEKEVEL